MNEEKSQILTQAIESRKKEVMEYQINIDNYVFAIQDIEQNGANDSDLIDFKTNLEELLASTKREQLKCKVILRALEAQLASL